MTITQDFKVHTLPNGITLLGEPMKAVSSAAFSILVPAGAVNDPQGREGAATLLAEMLNRGAGPWDAQQLSEQFEQYGIQRGNSAGMEVSAFSAAMLGENLLKAFEIYSTVLLEPRLPEDALGSVKQLALQDLKALEDEPASKVMSELAKAFYPAPFGRSQLGTEEGIEAVSLEELRSHFTSRYTAENSIISVAGNFDWDEVKAFVSERFGNWGGSNKRIPIGAFSEQDRTHHVQKDTSQVQIALAFPSVPIDHPDYYTARVAVGVLSGGMSGRLFVEVREKRGLVYRVSASHSAARDRAAVFASAGTTPENAEETLSVMLTELRGIKDGASDEELKRAKADLKSRLVMQSELSSVRASAMVNDWWNLKRLRTLEEIKAQIDAVTSQDISRHFEQYPLAPATLVTLGPKELQLPK